MQGGRLQVVHVDRILHHVVAVVVGSPVRQAGLDAAAGHPHREAARMMVASVVGLAELALAVDGAPELAAPDDKRVVQEAALLEVFHQRGRSLVCVARLQTDIPGEVLMLVPAPVEELHESHVPLGEPARQDAVRGVRARLSRIRTVALEHMVRLLGQIHQFRNRGLHAIGHFVLGDARLDLRIPELLRPHAVDLRHRVEHAASRGRIDSLRVRQIQHRVAARAKLDALVPRRQEAGAPQAREQRLGLVEVAALRDEHDESGQVVILAAQSVTHPRPHRRASGLLKPALNEGDRRVVIDGIGLHGLDERDVVHHLAGVGQEFAQFRSGLSVLLELEHRRGYRQPILAGGHAGDPLALADRIREILAVKLAQQRLVIEQVDLRRRAGLEHVDHALRLGGEVREARETAGALGRLRAGPVALASQQARQGQRPDPRRGATEELPSRDRQFVLEVRIHANVTPC